MATAVSLLTVLLFALPSVVTSKDKMHEIDKEQLLVKDEDVWFESLSESELAEHWSRDDGGMLAEKIENLKAFQATVLVDVKLIGFSGDGNKGFTLDQSELSRYFSASGLHSPVHVVNTKDHQTHDLPFTNKFLLRVKKGSRDLTARLAAAVQSSVGSQSQAVLPLVPIDDVDSVVAQDFKRHALTYTLYVLNLPPPKTEDGKRQRYAYIRGGGAGTPCATALWTSQRRYAWVDLTAGPVTFGPQTSGDGILTEYSLPHVERFLPSEATADSQVGHKPAPVARKHEFLAELAALVKKACDHLIAPPLDRFPVPFFQHISLNIIIVHDMPADEQQEALLTPWKEVISELKSLALVGQKVEVHTHFINFYDCELCVAAYTHSLKSHTSNILNDGLRTQVHQYLDSKEMRDWLEHFDTNFWGLSDSSSVDSGLSPDQVRVVTAFVYDLKTTDILLLDRFHQSVAFHDMVVAVQTKAPAAVVDFSCNTSPLQFRPNDASRAVLASFLQTVWAITPTHVVWNPFLNQTENNFMWSTGITPFGYFSSDKRLSFAQRDAAARHVLLSDINETLSELSRVLQHFGSFEKEIEEVLSPAEHLLFVRRWNVFQFKVTKTKHFMSVNNYNQSLYYSRSARHDLHAIHLLVHSAIDNITPLMLCAKDLMATSGWSWNAQLSLLVGGVGAFALLMTQTYSDSFLARRLFSQKKAYF